MLPLYNKDMNTGQRLPRITSHEVSKMPDQTSFWLNRLKDKVEKLESQASKTSSVASSSELVPATTTRLGGVIVGDNLTVTPQGRLSASAPQGVSTYGELPDKPSINGITLVGNKNLPDLNVNTVTNQDIENMFNNL